MHFISLLSHSLVSMVFRFELFPIPKSYPGHCHQRLKKSSELPNWKKQGKKKGRKREERLPLKESLLWSGSQNEVHTLSKHKRRGLSNQRISKGRWKSNERKMERYGKERRNAMLMQRLCSWFKFMQLQFAHLGIWLFSSRADLARQLRSPQEAWCETESVLWNLTEEYFLSISFHVCPHRGVWAGMYRVLAKPRCMCPF